MHPTLAGLYPFLLGSPARCAFLSYLCLYICLGSPARSRLSRSAVALTLTSLKSALPHEKNNPLTLTQTLTQTPNANLMLTSALT